MPMATKKLGLEFPGWNCFLVFYLFCTNKKGTKEEGKIGMYFENERISLEKNQSTLIGLLVDRLNYEPQSHVLPYSETHCG